MAVAGWWLGHDRCWGPAARHTETVQALLDAGVPPDELSTAEDATDPCMDEQASPETKELITHARIRKAVLQEARSDL